MRLWLGDGYLRVGELLAERTKRFLALASDGRTVSDEAREAVQAACEAVPVAIVSGAFRVEIDAILEGAGLSALPRAVVALEDVTHPKPDPEAYLIAAERLGVAPEEMVAFEDTAVGIAAAKSAGLRCVAVLGSQLPDQLRQADEIAERLDAALILRLLGS